LFLIALAASGCAEETGTVNVTVYGEDFIEKGIPAEEMADGWAVTFDKFMVTVEDVTIAGVMLPDGTPMDISSDTMGAGHAFDTAEVEAGSHTGSSFVIGNVEVAGSATKDGVTKTFAWTFEGKTQYTACEATTEVTEDTDGAFEITVHGDHFFFDSLASEDPSVVFQGLADADADGDDAITQEELAAADIGAYDPGSAGGVDNLWAWLTAQSRQLGHVDGEGHCDAAPHTD